MPTYVVGDIWSELGKAYLLFVTTNEVLKSDGSLVMGAGVAKEAATRYPHLPARLGRLIAESKAEDPFHPYGIVPGVQDQGTWICGFQTKRDWRDPSTVELVKFSTEALLGTVTRNPNWRVAMAFPGIGHGGLTKEQVKPILDALPEHVYIYSRS